MFTPTHSRRVSSVATTVGYVSATEGTEGSEGSALSPDIDEEEEEEELEEEFGPSIATIRPMADEESSTESLELDEEEEEPLVGRRRDEEKSLFGLVPPLILAHPLPLLPLLALLPYNFLPAGVVFFIPILCVLTLLSSCARIVIVYLAWYLKVSSFEEVFGSVGGGWGKHAGRVVVVSSMGMVVGWLRGFYPILQPVLHGRVESRMLWTVLPALFLLPSLLPSRITGPFRRSQVYLALLIPVVVFVVIGRTVELKEDLAKRDFGLDGSSLAGIATLTTFLSPHLNTLPIYSTLSRNARARFALPCLVSSGLLLAMALPFALVPYYLLPELPAATPTTRAGVFARLPDDGWVDLARVLQCVVGLGSANAWVIRGRDCIAGGAEGMRWVGLGLWVVVVGLACLGGVIADKVETLGVIATLALGWFLPAIFFIITFHVRSPLSIIFPRSPQIPPPNADSLADPSTDVMLARKERQLQKRRLGRRLWQDLVVYVGVLPVGGLSVVWAVGGLLGVW